MTDSSRFLQLICFAAPLGKLRKMRLQLQNRLKETGIFILRGEEYLVVEVEMAEKRRDRSGGFGGTRYHTPNPDQGGVFGQANQSDRTYDPARYRTGEDRQRPDQRSDLGMRLGAEYGGYGRETDYGSFNRGDDLVFGSSFGRSMGADESPADSSRRDHAGRGPKNYRRPDERIREDVCERLKAHPLVDATEIEVDVRDSVVMLKGAVIDRRQKRFAESASEIVRGVQDVRNELTVREPARKGPRH
jgi:osmotically-inducible protein OsmY